jgi:hypothetical protein
MNCESKQFPNSFSLIFLPGFPLLIGCESKGKDSGMEGERLG